MDFPNQQNGWENFTWQESCVLLDLKRKAKLLTPLTAGFDMELVFITKFFYF